MVVQMTHTDMLNLFFFFVGGFFGVITLIVLSKVLPNLRIVKHAPYWLDTFAESKRGVKFRLFLGTLLYRLGFTPRRSAYAGEPPELIAAGWIPKYSEHTYADYWILCPFDLLRDEQGMLRKEYW